MRHKEIVRAGYNKIASRYTAARTANSEDVRLLHRFVKGLPLRGAVLDAGCGSGYPVTNLLAKSFHVTGVDFSERQLRFARSNLPDSTFVCADIAKMPFKENAFDGLCSYYAIIHLPRREHPKLLADFHRILKRGGLALLCMGAGDLPEDTGDYQGTEMFWSHYDKDTNLKMLMKHGFDILWSKVVDDPIDPSSAHLFALVRKGRENLAKPMTEFVDF